MHHVNPPGTVSFRPPSWLENPHAQTIYAACLAPLPRVRWRRERWETPDADFVDLDWLADDRGTNHAGMSPQRPLIVLFHGLEGSSRSHYARTIMAAVRQRGWAGVVVHFRGCSGEPNRLARAYHSGDSGEMDWMLARLRRRWPGTLGVAAVSLGANVLLKWLGERAAQARRTIDCACAVSAPLDLVATGTALDRGFNRIYARNFLRTLRGKTLAKLQTHGTAIGTDASAVRATRTLRSFDDLVTSRMHGFRDALDYWTRASSKPWLRHIDVPTLLLNARDDPFLPAWALPAPDEVSASVSPEFPDHGGHVGFVTGRFPGTLDWLPQRILRFMEANLRRHEDDKCGMA